jgi:pimeloyl-ACP methyl ester carboxylesterase
VSKLEQQIRLRDGRALAYDEHGVTGGRPLLYFHGSPSARTEAMLFDLPAVAARLGIRLIVPDRPGLGLSDYQPGRRITDWPADVVALAETLGIDRFGVVGFSGGGPYALVCARLIPERLTAVGVVSAAAPFDVPGLASGIARDSRRFMHLAREKPWLSRLITQLMVLMARLAPERMVNNALAALPDPDRQFMSQPKPRAIFPQMIREAGRRGPRGAQWDTALMVSSWEFDPRQIELPVQLWHGEADQNAPVAMGRYLAGAIPQVRATFIPGEGHLSVLAKHAEGILKSVRDGTSGAGRVEGQPNAT